MILVITWRLRISMIFTNVEPRRCCGLWTIVAARVVGDSAKVEKLR